MLENVTHLGFSSKTMKRLRVWSGRCDSGVALVGRLFILLLISRTTLPPTPSFRSGGPSSPLCLHLMSTSLVSSLFRWFLLCSNFKIKTYLFLSLSFSPPRSPFHSWLLFFRHVSPFCPIPPPSPPWLAMSHHRKSSPALPDSLPSQLSAARPPAWPAPWMLYLWRQSPPPAVADYSHRRSCSGPTPFSFLSPSCLLGR